MACWYECVNYVTKYMKNEGTVPRSLCHAKFSTGLGQCAVLGPCEDQSKLLGVLTSEIPLQAKIPFIATEQGLTLKMAFERGLIIFHSIRLQTNCFSNELY